MATAVEELPAWAAELKQKYADLQRRVDPFAEDKLPIKDKPPWPPRDDIERLWRDVINVGPVEKATGRPITPHEVRPGEGFRQRADREAKGWERWKIWASLDASSKTALAALSRFSDDYGKMPLWQVAMPLQPLVNIPALSAADAVERWEKLCGITGYLPQAKTNEIIRPRATRVEDAPLEARAA
jgi:hypothetical protein